MKNKMLILVIACMLLILAGLSVAFAKTKISTSYKANGRETQRVWINQAWREEYLIKGNIRNAYPTVLVGDNNGNTNNNKVEVIVSWGDGFRKFTKKGGEKIRLGSDHAYYDISVNGFYGQSGWDTDANFKSYCWDLVLDNKCQFDQPPPPQIQPLLPLLEEEMSTGRVKKNSHN